jgi:hypothetical protein
MDSLGNLHVDLFYITSQAYDAAADGKQADAWGKTAFPARRWQQTFFRLID